MDPPHLRMVFDEAVVNSLTTGSIAPGSAVTAQTGHEASSSGDNMRSAPFSCGKRQAIHDADPQDPTTQLPRDTDHQSGTAGLDAAARDGVDALAHGEHKHRHSMCEEAEARLAGSEPATDVRQGGDDWQAVLQKSMQLAKDIRWTHKGLQVRGLSFVCVESLSPATHNCVWPAIGQECAGHIVRNAAMAECLIVHASSVHP